MDKWREIWGKRRLAEGSSILERILKTNGYDSGAGKVDEANWRKFIHSISALMDIDEKDSIYDVGCGCGAFLFPFYELNHKVGGNDFAISLIELAKDNMEDMDFITCNANELDTEEKYDHVVSVGVFHYFPDLIYAKEVIEKMLAKANKKIAIFDVPDISLKEESEEKRRAVLPEGEYEKKYKGLKHLYYDRNWFMDIAKLNHYKVEIFDQILDNYLNSSFRFNVIVSKNA